VDGAHVRAIHDANVKKGDRLSDGTEATVDGASVRGRQKKGDMLSDGTVATVDGANARSIHDALVKKGGRLSDGTEATVDGAHVRARAKKAAACEAANAAARNGWLLLPDQVQHLDENLVFEVCDHLKIEVNRAIGGLRKVREDLMAHLDQPAAAAAAAAGGV
jgi:hypothetical protein